MLDDGFLMDLRLEGGTELTSNQNRLVSQPYMYM